eukprot:1703311-Amphidinium_carterae.1
MATKALKTSAGRGAARVTSSALPHAANNCQGSASLPLRDGSCHCSADNVSPARPFATPSSQSISKYSLNARLMASTDRTGSG